MEAERNEGAPNTESEQPVESENIAQSRSVSLQLEDKKKAWLIVAFHCKKKTPTTKNFLSSAREESDAKK